MKYIKIVVVTALVALFAVTASAQKNIDISGLVKTSHLWRGYQISDEVTAAGSIDLMTNDGSLKGGIWGGYGVNGNFKEVDYYVQYSKAGFTVALWDIYNFSPGATYNNSEAFNYEADETGHFIDLSVAYRFGPKFPLQISWATVLFGRDRATNKDDETKNRYSNYIALDYPIGTFKGVKVDVGIAGAFAFKKGYDVVRDPFTNAIISSTKSDANFYGKTDGIVNVNLTVSKDITIGGYTLPVSVGTMWNPMSEDVYMCVSLGLF